MDTKVSIALVDSDRDITVEKRFSELRARGFVRGVTRFDQWHLLVNEGWKKTGLPMKEEVRDYLATMLNRYSTHADLLKDLSAFNHMAYMFGILEFETGVADEVADKCLQCAAFFPEMSTHRHEMKSYEYIIEIGRSLYVDLARESSGKDDCFSKAYKAMAEFFIQAMLILRSTCPKMVSAPRAKNGGRLLNTDVKAKEIGRTMGELEQVIFKGLSPFGDTVLQ